MKAVTELADRLKCPVVTTFKGKGLISDHHPLAGGVLGRSGTPIASWFMNESELLLVFGASFTNHTGITSKKPTIQVDYDPVALAKFHSVDCLIYGEIGRTVQILLDEPQGHALSAEGPSLVEIVSDEVVLLTVSRPGHFRINSLREFHLLPKSPKMADCNRKCNHGKLTVTNSGQFGEGFQSKSRQLV
jgi:glyoxylate carboligase